LTGLKETALYVADMSRARAFWEGVIGLKPMLAADARFCAYDVAGQHVLLLFTERSSTAAQHLPGGVIPPHDGSGPLHVGLSVDASELPAWQAHLAAHGIPIESTVTWPRGGRSIYFRDPDQHLVELLTPGVWPIF
jgi:catechol 2,3-dioxygenase-like lactoylglutathione lyase family enzyme